MFAIYRLDFVARTARVVSRIPGGIGDVFTPLVYCVPWLAFGLLLLLPVGIVQRRRRKRVEQVEQDLPLALELLATLSEAGLGFDSALARILESGLADRALAAEFRSFQADLVAGRSRVQALRRLSRRLEVSAVADPRFGAGSSGTTRHRHRACAPPPGRRPARRRRERANAFAASLSIKRMFPLVICFLPGLFIWILGPAFTQLFQYGRHDHPIATAVSRTTRRAGAGASQPGATTSHVVHAVADGSGFNGAEASNAYLLTTGSSRNGRSRRRIARAGRWLLVALCRPSVSPRACRGRGLLLVPCSSVHTFWMRFPLDLVMLDGAGQVVEVRRAVRPWRVVMPARKTFAILELSAGSGRLEIGDYLSVSPAAKSTQIPRSLQFLVSHRRQDASNPGCDAVNPE